MIRWKLINLKLLLLLLLLMKNTKIITNMLKIKERKEVENDWMRIIY